MPKTQVIIDKGLLKTMSWPLAGSSKAPHMTDGAAANQARERVDTTWFPRLSHTCVMYYSLAVVNTSRHLPRGSFVRIIPAT